MKTKEIKVRFENGKFVPLEKINLEEGEIIEIEITPEKKEKFSWRGALRDVKLTSVELQHKLKDTW